MKYVAYLKQDGEGCDYTIGCGLEMVKLKSDNLESAESELIDMIRESYTGDTSLESAKIYEVSNEKSVDLRSVYKKISDEKESIKRKKLEDSEKNEYERLVKKFGNFKG
jgi:hypothetical protein